MPALIPVAVEIPAAASLAIATALLAVMIVYETRLYGETRSTVRHDFAVQGPMAD